MPTVPMPLFTKVHKSVDGSVLSDDAALQYNGFLDSLGGLNIRPGETLAINSGKRSDGLYYWPDKNFIACAEDGTLALRVANDEKLTTQYSGTLTFPIGNPVIFCNDSNYLFCAGGGKINYVTSTGTVTEITDTDAPTNVTHVAFLDGYILANNGTNRFHWSDYPTTTSWGASFASAEANPDILQALYVVQRQIYLLGTVSTEIWENDGTTPFSRIPGGLIEVGCAAKYSSIKRRNSLIWLSHTREFVEFTGTEVKFISSRYDREIANFKTVSDCIGGWAYKDGQEFYIFSFPTEKRTLVYNPRLEDWCEWGAWNPSTLEWMPYDFRGVTTHAKSGKTFVGKGNATSIACLNSDSRVDLTSGGNSARFKFLRQTGFIDSGTNKRKCLEELSFRARRGAPEGVTSPKLMLRYRNNGSSQWSNIIDIDLGEVGDLDHHISLKRLGIYSSRQFEISATDNTPIILSKAEANLTVLQ